MASGFLFGVFLSGLLVAASGCEEKRDCPASCPPGWTQYGCKCFHFNYATMTWPDAERYCLSAGGNLASVHSMEEYEFIRVHIKTVTGKDQRSWIGGHDGVQEGVWLWADGSKMDFTQWHGNEPNNLGGKEHCLEMNFAGNNWNDRPCTSKHSLVCSKDAKTWPCCHGSGGGKHGDQKS